MCDEAVDGVIAALKLIPNWFFTSKMIKNLFAALCADENIHYFNEHSSNVIFSSNEKSILNTDINNINLDNKFDEYDPDTNILTRLSAPHMKFERRKELKKMLNEELKSIGWHANRWWD